jgi:RNA polymerase sigma-54 factor
MALEQKLSLKLAQKLVMTPSLQQAIKLLQMTRMELQGVLSQELVENPILEETPETSTAEEEVRPEEEAREREKDELDHQESMENIDLEAYFGDYYESSGYASVREQREAPPLENTLTHEPDLYDHLLWQISVHPDISPRQREIAELIIGNLDPDGYLVASVEELQNPDRLAWSIMADQEEDEGDGEAAEDEAPITAAEEALLHEIHAALTAADEMVEARGEDSGEPEPLYTREEVEAVLTLVRGLEPPGVACRDLRESLIFQLDLVARQYREDYGEDDEYEANYHLARTTLEEHWDLFVKRQFSAVAKQLQVPLKDLEPAVDLIRTLELRPGRQYNHDRPQYIEPDVAVIRVGDEYVIQLNDDGMPRLRISRAYRRMLQKMKSEGDNNDAQQYIKDKMRSALWLIKSLDQRQRTIYKVANSIVRQQQEFLDRGIDRLRPMVLRDVAEDIGMHESTVSRVVANKYINTPRGLFPMKFFFHSGIDREYGENISSLTVKRKIQQSIEAEDPKRPLSDSELMRILKREGIQIARRTVAKYRDELSIPSSTDRKQIF